MNQPMTQGEQRRQKIREARAWLQERFPAVFGGDGGIPLAIGAHKQAHEVANAEGGPEHWVIQVAIGGWVRRPRYLKAVKAQRLRRRLDGTEAEAVTDEQAEHARKELEAQRRKKAVAREQERQRQAKLEASHSPEKARVEHQGQEARRSSPAGQPAPRQAADDAAARKTTPKGPNGCPVLTLKKNRRRPQEGTS